MNEPRVPASLRLPSCKRMFLAEASAFRREKLGASLAFEDFFVAAMDTMTAEVNSAKTPDELDAVFLKWRRMSLSDWANSL